MTTVIIGHYELVSGVAKMVVGNGEGLNLSLLGVRTSSSVGNLMRHLGTQVDQHLGFRVKFEIILGVFVTNPISNEHCVLVRNDGRHHQDQFSLEWGAKLHSSQHNGSLRTGACNTGSPSYTFKAKTPIFKH